MRRAVIGLTAALLLAGCARNAVLELSITLPAATDQVRFAFVEVSEDDLGENPFTVQWASSGLAAIPLGSTSESYPVSIVSDGFRGDALLRVSFCADEDCMAVGPPRDPLIEVRTRIESPLYTGVATSAAVSLDGVLDTGSALPAECVREGAGVVGCVVERCRVAGCSVGTGREFCIDGLSGAHFCE
ncbi:MAG: hypothetical protein AB8I08_35450 [Sandaracinaceae bacterium]